MNITTFLQTQVDSRSSYGAGEWKTALNLYKRLSDDQREIADEGIIRYLKACDNLDVLIDAITIKEIATDAPNLRTVWTEDDYLTNNERVGYGPADMLIN